MQQLEQVTTKTVIKSVTIGRWTSRFIWAAIIQGLAALLWTVPIVLPTVKPSVAMIMASGGPGTWFTVGYLAFITVGVIAIAVTALFYRFIEVDMNRPYSGARTYLAWTHLILMNVGVAAATFLMMYGGYMGGAALLPAVQGGLGQTAGWVHVNVLGGLVQPIGYAIIAAGVGALAGGFGFVLSYFRR
jgi:hypothetical protein